MVKSSDLWLAHTNNVDETIEKAGIPVLRKGWECKHYAALICMIKAAPPALQSRPLRVPAESPVRGRDAAR